MKHLHNVPVRSTLNDPFASPQRNLGQSLTELVGFSLRVGRSRIPRGGRGVFVSVCMRVNFPLIVHDSPC